MQLIYLFLKEYGPFIDRGFEFNSNYHVEHSRDTGEISIEKRDFIPENFFRVTPEIDGEKCCSDVECRQRGDIQVSAIIGRNGSGKTSIFRALFDIVKMNETAADIREFREDIEFVYKIQYLLVVLSNGVLHLYQNMPGHLKGVQELSREEYRPFKGCADMFYYSPYYHAAHFMPSNQENGTFDVSTSKLLFEETGDESDNTFVRLPPADLFRFREMMRIIEFSREWKLCEKAQRDLFTMSIPKGIVVAAERGAMERLETFVENYYHRDPRYRELRAILHVVDAFYNSLIAYVADSLNWHYYLERLHNEPIPNELSDKESELLDIFVSLGKSLHFSPDTPMDEVVQIEERLELFANALAKLEQFSVDGLTNDRGSYKDGLKMFKLILANMSKHKDDQIAGNIIFPTDDDDVLKDLGLMLELQANARGFWKTDYIRFEFEFLVSSGELAYISMYSRIYHYLHKWNEEVGEDAGNVLIFLDEAETTLHPKLQRQLVANAIAFCEVFFPKTNFHLVFASHSPILLSDIPSENVIYLDPNNNSEMLESFGANIFDLYRSGFFLENGTVGSFAQKEIDDLVEKVFSLVRNEGKSDKREWISVADRQLVDLIADKNVAHYLREWLKELDRGKNLIR